MAAASVAMIGLAVPMNATVLGTFNDRTAWSTSLTGVTTADFNETMASGTYQLYSNATGYTSGVLNFLGLSTLPNPSNPSSQTYELKRFDDGTAKWLVGPSWVNSSQDTRLVINLSNAATAFGIDIASSVAGISYQITVLSPSPEAFTVTSAPLAPATTFFGVRTDAAISQVVIRMVSSSSGHPVNGDESRFDNASTGFFSAATAPPSETPETSTIIYGATGIFLLAWTRRRRTRS